MHEAVEKPDDIELVQCLSPDEAATLRVAITFLGYARHCPLKICKRARACATRQVLCWQVHHDDFDPEIMRLLARSWQKWVAEGTAPAHLPPAVVDAFACTLAEEDADAPPEPSGAPA